MDKGPTKKMTMKSSLMKASRPVRKKKITFDRFVIPCRVYGSSGPCIICLNGAHQSMAMWRSFVTFFSHDYRILLFDFPGLGQARALSGPSNLSLDEQVDILHAVMEASQFERDTILCTASWGGVVALAFAARYPHAVRRLVLGSIGTRPNPKMVETIQKGLSIDPEKRLEMAQVLLESFGQKLPENIKNRIIRQFHEMSKDSLRAFSEHGLYVLLSLIHI